MKKTLLLITLTLFIHNLGKSQSLISTKAYGQNANYTDTIGIVTGTGGKMEKYWQTTAPLDTQNYVRLSRVSNMRYSGIQA
ncbi:MAG: hypothetical protein H0W61_12495 [Bacteroidetes bacterium]|nr:hypothetical protein [Bacteroidota bacterium]